jgi:uncharacterized protein YndB with AHSA1/START domain
MSDLGRLIAPGTLQFERLMPGPIERVWDYLTKTELLATWFMPGTIGTRVGADVSFEFGMIGTITAYEPPRLVEYTWNEAESSVGAVIDALVRWELREQGDRVLLILTHSRMPAASISGFGAGWHAGLAGLAEQLDGTEPSPDDNDYTALEARYAELVTAGSK